MKNLATMLKPLALSVALLAIFVISQGTAKADVITFTSTGIFTGPGAGSGTQTYTVGSGANLTTLTFTDGANSTVAPPPSNVNFGVITIATSGEGASLDGTTLTLNIVQTSPSDGSNTFVGQLTGTIFQTPAPGGSSAQLVFSVNSFTIGNVIYTIQPVYLLPAPGTGNQVTLQGTVNTAPIPEPATMLLLGTGLAGVAASVRKRRKAA
jgi:hypothetical protein